MPNGRIGVVDEEIMYTQSTYLSGKFDRTQRMVPIVFYDFIHIGEALTTNNVNRALFGYRMMANVPASTITKILFLVMI